MSTPSVSSTPVAPTTSITPVNKHKFVFDDKTEIEFSDFDPRGQNPGTIFYCYLPPLKPGPRGSAYTAQVYITTEDAVLVNTARRKGLSKEEQAKIRIGVLAQGTGHPFERGLYIPYKIDEHGYRLEHWMNGLYSDFSFCPYIKK